MILLRSIRGKSFLGYFKDISSAPTERALPIFRNCNRVIIKGVYTLANYTTVKHSVNCFRGPMRPELVHSRYSWNLADRYEMGGHERSSVVQRWERCYSPPLFLRTCPALDLR